MEGKREGEKHQCVVASREPCPGYLARNPGMCPDWESIQRPFGSQASTQSTELYQPGQKFQNDGIYHYPVDLEDMVVMLHVPLPPHITEGNTQSL